MDRRSVARGVALGLFCGVIVPFGQSVAAALVAVPLRANLAVAALCTFITNPFTTPFVYLGAYQTGSWLLHARGGDFTLPHGRTVGEWLVNCWDWLLHASGPVVLGLLVISLSAAAMGYVATHWSWRAWVARRWRSRRRSARALA